MFRRKVDPLDRGTRWSTWLGRIGKGDTDALGAFYDESSPLIFGLVLHILQDQRLAEDVLLEIYNNVRRQARRFSSRKQNPVEWLIDMAQEFATCRLRLVTSEQQPSTAIDPFNSERTRANSALRHLTEEQRSILEMTYFGGLTIDEVADRLDVPREYVSKQILFGMRKLRTMCDRTIMTSEIRSLETGNCEMPIGRRLYFG
jgi:RNA polymerase sigma-70 factor (ECF subfamily)